LKKVAYFHLLNKNNKYSAYALIAALESRFPQFRSDFVRRPKEVLDHVNKYDKVILGVTLMTTDLLNENYLDEIISLKGKVILVAGGPHPTGDPYGTLSLGFDLVVHGEGEETLGELISALSESEELDDVKGLYLSDFRFTGRRKQVDLNDFPPWPYWRGLFGPIEITRGCPFACAYCQTSFIFKSTVRHRSVENVVRYAELLKKLGGKDLRFITPNALSYGGNGYDMRLDLIEELLSKLKKVGVRTFFGSFPSEVRPEFVKNDSIKIIEKYASNKRIVIGAQSASNKMLKLLHRGHTWEDVVNAVDISVKHGITPEVDFILGLPGETEEDMEITLNGMKELINMGARAHLHYFMPLPGTPLAFSYPTKLPDKIRKEVANLVGKGKAWGQWLKQEKISWKIVELRERGVIMIRPYRRREVEPKLINPNP